MARTLGIDQKLTGINKWLDKGDLSIEQHDELWKALAQWDPSFGPSTNLIEVTYTPRALAMTQPSDPLLHFSSKPDPSNQTKFYSFPDDPLRRPLLVTDGNVNLNLWWMEGIPEKDNPLHTKTVKKTGFNGTKMDRKEVPLSTQNPLIGQLPGFLSTEQNRVGELAAADYPGTVRGLKGEWYYFENGSYKKDQFVDIHGRLVAVEYDRIFMYFREYWNYNIEHKDARNSRQIMILDPRCTVL